jgi:hypothetical protein
MTEAKKVKPRLAPVDLDMVKDDLGMPAGDTANDAWLQRRIDAVWARFQNYTGRTLALAGPWIDDWSEISQTNARVLQPPLLNPARRATAFLRVFPVKQVDGITYNAVDSDPAQVIVDQPSGKVLSLNGAMMESDCAPQLISGLAVISYTAGFDTLPEDIYEAMIHCLEPLWSVRQAQQSGFGGPGGAVTRIAATDVGEVDFSYGLGGFALDASKKSAPDPLLGPWATMLDPYVDWRAFIGSENYPTTKPGPAAAKEPAS